jgi:hypothetical protein
MLKIIPGDACDQNLFPAIQFPIKALNITRLNFSEKRYMPVFWQKVTISEPGRAAGVLQFIPNLSLKHLKLRF